jgi:hypothetical protein
VISGQLPVVSFFWPLITNHWPLLFHFFMRRVLAATAAEFLEFQPLGRRLPVLRGRVIPLFALTTL